MIFFLVWKTHFRFIVRTFLRHANVYLIDDWSLFDTRAYLLIVVFWWMICWLQLFRPVDSHLQDLIDHACTLEHASFVENILYFFYFMTIWFIFWSLWVITLGVHLFSLSSLSQSPSSPKPFSLFLDMDHSFVFNLVLGVLSCRSCTHLSLSLFGLFLIILVSFMASFHLSFLSDILFLEHHLGHTHFTTYICSLPIIP